MLNAALNLNQNIFTSNPKKCSTRDGFGESLLILGEKYQNLVVLTADLAESVRVQEFAKKFPERFIECGIAEQNMTSIAAGLALNGKIPFITSHAIFTPSTNWAQIRQSVCLTNANVKMVGSHQGFSNGPDGGVAEPLEDVAILRVLPNLTIVNPIDCIQTMLVVEQAVKTKGPVYIRLSKAETPVITTENTPYKTGEALLLKEGTDATLISSGPITSEALTAARHLIKEHKVDIEVLAYPTIKPFDEKTLLKSAKKTGKVITLEEHQIIGGLGGAVAEILSENQPTPLLRLGMNDKFGESGKYRQLLEKYKLDAIGIIDSVLEFLK